jgi:hypothetical protein
VIDGDTGETGGELGDESAGDGEADEERPGALELALEEHRPGIEQPHPNLLLCAGPCLALPLCEFDRARCRGAEVPRCK